MTVFSRLFSVFMVILCLGCSKKENVLRVGVTSGPHEAIMEKVKIVAQKQGLDIEIVTFNDFVLPNEALLSGEIDINSYQHELFLKKRPDADKFLIIGKTVLMPLGLYSKHHTSVEQLGDGAVIAIPNDPTNSSRALKLLQDAGLLKFKSDDLSLTVHSIIGNKFHLSLVEVEAPQLPMVLEDVDGAVINTDWVIQANIDPKLALYREGDSSPYVNVLVIKKGSEKDPRFEQFLQCYHNMDVKAFIEKQYHGSVQAVW